MFSVTMVVSTFSKLTYAPSTINPPPLPLLPPSLPSLSRFRSLLRGLANFVANERRQRAPRIEISNRDGLDSRDSRADV